MCGCGQIATLDGFKRGKKIMGEGTRWASSLQGREIRLYTSSAFLFGSGQRPLLFIGGVHGDEPEGVLLAEATLSWLLEEYKGELPWLLIPCLNPDGFALGTRGNGRGVDLNRNYPSRGWSQEAQSKRYDPGESPASEPEVSALVQLILSERPRLIIHAHSWEPCIVFTGDRARRDGQRLAQSSGYELKSSIGYPTPGSLSQFGWHDHQIPIICIEERAGEHRSKIWPHFARGIQEIFEDESLRDGEDS